MNNRMLADAYQKILSDMDVEWLKPKKEREGSKTEKISGIFLPSISEQYADATHKIMVIGRETAGWNIYGNRTDDKKKDKPKEYNPNADYTQFKTLAEHIDRAMLYHRALFKEHSAEPSTCKFFQFIKSISEKSGSEGLVHGNLLCFDWDRKTPIGKEDALLCKIKTYSELLLRAQIRILNPDIIIFAHGNFAAKTRNELLLDKPECKHPWKIIWDGTPYHQDIKQSELERFHLSYYNGEENRQITGFRIYHPRTLSRKARKCLIENLPQKNPYSINSNAPRIMGGSK